MSRWMRVTDAFGEWTLRRKWEFRFLWTAFMGYFVYRQLDEWGESYWPIIATTVSASMMAAVFWMWWRQDVLAEFEQRARAALGSDANLLIWCARLQLRTLSVRKLNRVMREYDIMSVPALDLPQEAKELREILESLQTK